MSYTGIEGVVYNDATGMYEPERKTFYDEAGNAIDMNATFGGRNITLGDSRGNYGSTPQKTPEEILSETVATLTDVVPDTGGTSGTSTDGFDLAAYMAGLQSDIDSYVPGAYGEGFLDEVEEENKASQTTKKEEEPYKEEIEKLKLPDNVFKKVETGQKGIEEKDWEDKSISFDGKGYDEYMRTDGDKKEIQLMLDAGMSKAQIKRWGKALDISNVNEQSEAEAIVNAFQTGYLPGQKPKTSFELTDKVQDSFGNVFTNKDLRSTQRGGASAEEIESFLTDYTKGGGRVTDKVYNRLGVFGGISKDYGNKFDKKEMKELEATGATEKDIKKFLNDFIDEGGKVGRQVQSKYLDFEFL